MAQLTPNVVSPDTPLSMLSRAIPGAVPPKRYRIGELARHTGLTRQTLHNYTHWGLIQEAEWTPGGHRLYDESVFGRLGQILELRKDHTVEEMKAILGSAGQSVSGDGSTQGKEGVDGQ